MKQILLPVCLLLFTSCLFSQQAKIDSLRAAFKLANHDTTKLNLLKEIAEETYYIDSKTYMNVADSLLALAIKTKNVKYIALGHNARGRYFHKAGNDEKSKQEYNMSLLQYKKINDQSGMATAYGNIATIYVGNNNIDSSRYYLNKAIRINKKNGVDTNLFFNYYNLGIAESNRNNYEGSLLNILTALKYAEKIKNTRFIAYCNSMIGVLYMEQEMYDEAEKYLLKAKVQLKEIEDSFGLASQYVNLGKIYNERDKDYPKAIEFYKKAVSNYNKIGDSLNGSVALGNIGRNFIRMEKLDSARFYINKSLGFSLKVDNPDELVRSLTNMGEIEFKLKNYQRAKANIQQAISIAKEHSFMEDYGEALLLLSGINAEELDYKNAYQNVVAYQTITDSIKSAETKEMIVEMSDKYQTEKKEKENLTLKQQNAEQALLTEKEKTQKWAMGGGLAVSLAGLGIFIIVFRKNQKQKKEIVKQKDLVEKLQRELHHRLKNNLSFIDFFITLAKGKFPDPAYRAKLDELQNRINSMFEVHKQLFKKEDVTKVNAKTFISALVENVKKAYAVPNITLEENVADTDLRADTSFPIGLIVNEFVTNSYKYAFPNNQPGIVSINLKEEKNEYSLQLRDNGKGLPKDFDIDNLNSFGMETIKLLTQEYKGSFKLDGSNGTRIDITFPKNAA